jgi:spore germination cell wall hydrolase CwlJ-like protein
MKNTSTSIKLIMGFLLVITTYNAVADNLNSYHVKTDETAITCLADNMYFEARGESFRGEDKQLELDFHALGAVAKVTVNRALFETYYRSSFDYNGRNPFFDQNRTSQICDVVYSSNQFSWVRDSRFNNPENINQVHQSEDWIQIRNYAEEILNSNDYSLEDYASAPLFYVRCSKDRKGHIVIPEDAKSWWPNLKLLYKYKHHCFATYPVQWSMNNY